jgi:hypothetical protein
MTVTILCSGLFKQIHQYQYHWSEQRHSMLCITTTAQCIYYRIYDTAYLFTQIVHTGIYVQNTCVLQSTVANNLSAALYSIDYLCHMQSSIATTATYTKSFFVNEVVQYAYFFEAAVIWREFVSMYICLCSCVYMQYACITFPVCTNRKKSSSNSQWTRAQMIHKSH